MKIIIIAPTYKNHCSPSSFSIKRNIPYHIRSNEFQYIINNLSKSHEIIHYDLEKIASIPEQSCDLLIYFYHPNKKYESLPLPPIKYIKCRNNLKSNKYIWSKKHCFFLMDQLNIGHPRLYDSLDQAPLPVLVRANDLWGGQQSYLVETINDGKRRIAEIKDGGGDPIIVEFIDTSLPHFHDRKLYINTRLFMYCGQPVFLHTNISDKDWCVHSENTTILSKQLFLRIQYYIIDVIHKNIDIFNKIYHETETDNLAIDFGVTQDGKVIIFELEMKYGASNGYLSYTKNRYNLTDAEIEQIQKKLNDYQVKYSTFLTLV